MTARILVVDDIAANRQLLEAKLVAEYYDVTQAASGIEALATIRRMPPDVVLLDVMMPEMDGYEVCRRIKAEPTTTHLPVVMVTALVDTAERVRGLEAGADDFLSKPVDDATLFARLRALLRIKQVHDAWRLRSETARALGFEPLEEPAIGCEGARAVVIGQDPEERGWIGAILGGEGIIAECADADSVPRSLVEGNIDLAVLCLATSGAETLRLASRLRAGPATRDLPLLLVAHPGQRDLVLRAFDLGANDHVLRPVDPNELRARTRNQIRRRRTQERLRRDIDRSLELAVTDPLTGLRNRRYVQRHLETLLRSSGAAVLMLDIDHFKTINDAHGHAAGDEALCEVANRLRTDLRAADVIARYGGEEFLVVLAGAPADYALAVAERLRRAVAGQPVAARAGLLAITTSIGVTLASAGASADAVIAAADAALYRAKALGRNRVETALLAPDTGPMDAGPMVAPAPAPPRPGRAASIT